MPPKPPRVKGAYDVTVRPRCAAPDLVEPARALAAVSAGAASASAREDIERRAGSAKRETVHVALGTRGEQLRVVGVCTQVT